MNNQNNNTGSNHIVDFDVEVEVVSEENVDEESITTSDNTRCENIASLDINEDVETMNIEPLHTSLDINEDVENMNIEIGVQDEENDLDRTNDDNNEDVEHVNSAQTIKPQPAPRNNFPIAPVPRPRAQPIPVTTTAPVPRPRAQPIPAPRRMGGQSVVTISPRLACSSPDIFLSTPVPVAPPLPTQPLTPSVNKVDSIKPRTLQFQRWKNWFNDFQNFLVVLRYC